MGLNVNWLAGALLFGLLAGWHFTGEHYRGKIERTEAAQQKAEEKRNEKIGELATFWQAKLDTANSVDPVVIERVRVRVKECAVQAAGSDAVDDGAATARAELDAGVIQNLERLAQRKEQQYRECSHRLRSLQEAFAQ